jgi:putative phosphoesterase
MPRGGRQLPSECLRRLEAADLIVHAGDFVAASVLEDLRRLGPVEGVHGNMDEPTLRSLLPAQRVVEAGAVRIGVVHDGGPREGREARLAGRFPGCHAVVYGHSHLPQLAEHDGVLILNPGSPTERRRSPERSMLELEIGPAGIRPRLILLDT